MRNLLVRLAFATLRHYDARLWWNNADVLGLFDPAMGERVVFKFSTRRFYSMDSEVARVADNEGFNFSHPWPPDEPE